MSVVIVTGAAGLIGSEAVEFFADKFDQVIGIDNNYREVLFGADASVEWNRMRLENQVTNYKHYATDIRNYEGLEKIFQEYSSDIKMIVHTAAQPSHDWAAKEPLTDFTINANGTLNLLELTRQYAEKAVFIFTSTNKVYGDNPNKLPLVELDTRWEVAEDHMYFEKGIPETMSLDDTKHSLFGASKVAADVLAQEYGKYFGMNVGVFRGGCLTGPKHSGTQLHGFLSYLMKCAITGDHYTVFGYKGKQVRDNIHSWDLVNMFWHFYQNPMQGEAYNAGGSRHSNCSMQEGIALCEKITGKKMNYTYSEDNRIGDHMWWISDISKFRSHYPDWEYKYNLEDILVQIHDSMSNRV
ncbi:NAD-dependent epimerase/dehydratase family protein [Algivirga pacifica]|uniref:NAD-dependent epimerase/dehydratase family protein n=1 Tax=Algivirga pacifica TaxID=1162670 RepID=A0ABP9DN14_9BACT